MVAVSSRGVRSTSCVPQDAFWQKNRELAELIWHRGDGSTVSTRVSEDVHRATGVPARKAKTNLHAVVAVGAGLVTAYLASRVTSDPALRVIGLAGAVAVAKKTFRYLEQDRCD